jgi:hypothetical protein
LAPEGSRLSLSHLLSSAFTNVLILGVLSVAQPIVFTVGAAYYLISFFLAVILLLFLVFYRSRGRLERFEGGILLACYFIFWASISGFCHDSPRKLAFFLSFLPLPGALLFSFSARFVLSYILYCRANLLRFARKPYA